MPRVTTGMEKTATGTAGVTTRTTAPPRVKAS
jgi:hypothetical protein